MGFGTARYYPVEGTTKQYPSVTTITGMVPKPFLYQWYGKIGNAEAKRISEESMNIGSQVHNLIDNYFKNPEQNKDVEVIEGAKTAYNNFLKFNEEYKPKMLLSEKTVYNHEHRYAGTLDGVFEIGGINVLLDWKTSSGIYEDYELQLEAYYEAMRSEPTLPGIDEMWVVRLAKDEDISYTRDILKITPKPERFQAFLGLLTLFNWLENRKALKAEKSSEKKRTKK